MIRLFPFVAGAKISMESALMQLKKSDLQDMVVKFGGKPLGEIWPFDVLRTLYENILTGPNDFQNTDIWVCSVRLEMEPNLKASFQSPEIV